MPTEIKIVAEQSFIGGWIIDDISICDNLIEYFENKPNKHEGYIIDGNKESVIKSVKDSIDLALPRNEKIVKDYLVQLENILNLYKKKYPRCNNTSSWAITENINMQKYNPGGGYFNWHSERLGPNSDRHLVFMTYLNDVTDQGETEFDHQKIKVPPRKGLTLIWPADWTHFHRGITSPSQTKYIITGWYNFI